MSGGLFKNCVIFIKMYNIQTRNYWFALNSTDRFAKVDTIFITFF